MNLLYDLLEDRTLYVSAHRNNTVLSLQVGQWSQASMQSPRGMGVEDGCVGIVCGEGIRFFREDGSLASLVYYDGKKVDGHGATFIDGKFIIAASAQSCLLEVDRARGSFTNVWQVPGVDISDDSRAHINGVDEFYVTGLALSNEAGRGWRDAAQGSQGVILDECGNVVIKDLFLPHSPLLTEDHLWFINSGNGELCRWWFSGKYEVVSKFDGFARGLRFLSEDYIAVGISQGRITAFPNLSTNPLAKPGISVINVRSGIQECFEPLDVQEVFEIQIGTSPLQMNVSNR